MVRKVGGTVPMVGGGKFRSGEGEGNDSCKSNKIRLSFVKNSYFESASERDLCLRKFVGVEAQGM